MKATIRLFLHRVQNDLIQNKELLQNKTKLKSRILYYDNDKQAVTVNEHFLKIGSVHSTVFHYKDMMSILNVQNYDQLRDAIKNLLNDANNLEDNEIPTTSAPTGVILQYLTTTYPELSQYFLYLHQNQSNLKAQLVYLLNDPKRVQKAHDIYYDVPKTITPISIYALKHFNDTHALDRNSKVKLHMHTNQSKNPISVFNWTVHILCAKYNQPYTTEFTIIEKLFNRHNLQFEQTLNHVWTYNITSQKNIYTAIPKKYVYDINIRDDIKDVYLHENSGVVDALIEKHPDKSFICTSGQLSGATHALIQRLLEKGITLYYSGDMDLPGLSIAEQVLSEYPSIRLYKMDVTLCDDYAVSVPKIRKAGIAENLKHPALKTIAEDIINNNRIVFQEMLIDHY